MEITAHDFVKDALLKAVGRQLLLYRKAELQEPYTIVINKLISLKTQIRFHMLDEERLISLWEHISENELTFDIISAAHCEWFNAINLSGITNWESVRDVAATALGSINSYPNDNKRDFKELFAKLEEAVAKHDAVFFETVKDHEWWRAVFTRYPIFLTCYYITFIDLGSDK